MSRPYRLNTVLQPSPAVLDRDKLQPDAELIGGWYYSTLDALEGRIQGVGIARALVGEEQVYALGPSGVARLLLDRYGLEDQA